MPLEWRHKSDDTTCTTASKQSGEWTCIPHDRLVNMYPISNVKVLPNDPSKDEQLESFLEVVNQAAANAGIEPLPPGASSAEALHNHPREVRAREVAERSRAFWEPTWEKVLKLALQQLPSEEHESVSQKAVESGVGRLKLVGWYCAGGHEVNFHGHGRPITTAEGAPPSLRFDDPCEYGVPAFIVKPKSLLDEAPSPDAPCEGCGAHLAQCRRAAELTLVSCCSDCEHHVP